MLTRLNPDGTAIGQPPITDYNFRLLFPDKYFEQVLLPAVVEELGWGLYDYTRPPECQKYEKAVEIVPVKDSRGIFMQTWSVVPMTDVEIAQVDATKAAQVREARSRYLYLSDWTQLADAPLSSEKKSEWTAYRQALRDITSQTGFPWDIAWPNQPAK